MARKDRDMPSAPSAAIVDEQTQRAAMRTPAPAASPASVRRFEETGAGFSDPVVEEVVEPVGKTIVKPKRKYTYTDEKTGDLIDVYEDDTEVIRRKGTKIADAEAAAEATAAERIAEKESAFDILRRSMKENGLEALADAAIDAIMNEETEAGRLLALRSSPAYMQRFSANEQRKLKGLKVLDEASYLAMEDQYQEVMRQYGLPESYYAKDATGKQVGFEQLLANDVSNIELGDRLMIAQDRVLKSNPEVLKALKDFYPDITNGDILAYTLDPKNAIKDIQRKVTAAEIGGAQLGAGLQATVSNAETLARAGVTGRQYQAKATDIAEASLRGGQLAAIYGQDPYTQQMAEQVQLDTPGSVESLKKTKKITGLEKATFGGQSGITQGALARDRAGGY
jgi:hypothetical protein